MYHIVLVRYLGNWFFEAGSYNASKNNQTFGELKRELGKNNVHKCIVDNSEWKTIERVILAKQSLERF